ncbi:glycoside hydrolase N-terminal domain-containing protein [Planctomycetota bacterium]
MSKTVLTLLAIGCFTVGTLQARTPPVDESNNPTASYTFTQDAPAPDEALTLWYRKPATKWETEALPVGNGPLAAMVFGGINTERIQFNEETVWDGVPQNTNNPEALAALPEVRRLLFENKNDEATKLAKDKMMGKPYRIKSYQTLGDLMFDFPDTDTVAGYRRDLDLTTAIAKVQYQVAGVNYTREVFVTAPDRAIVVNLKADQPGQINFTAHLQRDKATVEAGSRNRLILRGQLTGIKYEAQLLPMVSGGSVTTQDGKLDVSKADEVTLLLVGATSYNNAKDISGNATARCEKALWAAAEKSYSQLRGAHLADYQSLFSRVKLDLGSTDAVKKPTDERLRAVKRGAFDPQ